MRTEWRKELARGKAIPGAQGVPDPTARNSLGARQIHDFTKTAQCVELSRPVAPHAEDGHLVAPNVIRLLVGALHGNHPIDIPDAFDDLDAFRVRGAGRLAPMGVEFIRRDD